MGWAWRSAESYGDKDEPAEKPDTDSPGAKEPEASGSDSEKKSWWDQFHSESKEDDYYDWRGYQGSVSDTERYSYSQSIDDSDKRWYRKSSFKYSKYTDYSPSSLFRSAFYSPRGSYFGGSTSEENEAKNKAIRALRTLSRNANTICDKNAKISYAVQYSNGIDANTFSDNLIDGKSVRTIYVSPDSVVDAKTTEDEDAAVDALTGFVLLRVQIAQDFNAGVITAVNATTLKSLPTKLLGVLKDEKADAAPLAAEYVDDCLSGMLSKGLLTRLARRHVVRDWGGFAPYFVRHAKKFTAVREKLEKIELSVESLVGKLTYNLVDDENAFDLGEDVEKIVAQHLGEEVAPENILATCRELVAKLREYVRLKVAEKADGSTETGPIENDLRELLKDFIEKHGKDAAAKKREAAAAKEMLNELAQAMSEQFELGHREDLRNSSAVENYQELQNEMHELAHIEQFINSVKEMTKGLAAHADLIEKAKENPADLEFHASRARYEQLNINSKMSHFSATRNALKRRGANDTFDAMAYHAPTDAALPEILKKEIEALEQLLEEYQRVSKESFNANRDKIAEIAKKYYEQIAADKKLAEEAVAKTAEHAKAITEKHEAAGKPLSLEQIAHEANKLAKVCREQFETVADAHIRNERAIESCRSVKTLKSEYERFVSNTNSSFACDLRHNWQYNCETTPMANFAQSGVRDMERLAIKAATAARDAGEPIAEAISDKLKTSDWTEKAIKKFLADLQNAEAGFEAQALSQTHAEAFEQLEKLFGDPKNPGSAGSVPNGLDDVENTELKERLKRLAESLGFEDADALLQLFNEAKAAPSSTLQEAGKEIGQKICKIMPLFDELNSTDNELFGQVVGVKTMILADSTKQVNDEARNDPEEEYVAYLSHSEAKPVVHVERPKISHRARKEVDEARKRMRNVITRIHEALQFHNTKRTGDIYGASSGDLDEGGLHKLSYDCEHIWSQKTIAQIPDVAVGILVDQSGSMSGGTKIFEAREMCIALAEAIKKIPGIHLHIYGHTANTKNMSDLTLFEHYSSTSDTGTATADLGRLGTIDSMSNNYDGYAIKETAKLLSRDPAKRKFLFVIADGLPHGEGYAGKDAEKHVTSVCKFVRERLKIATYAFAVGVHGTYRDKFVSQYGRDNVMFLTNVQACLPQITRFLRNTIQKEKTLVEIGT